MSQRGNYKSDIKPTQQVKLSFTQAGIVSKLRRFPGRYITIDGKGRPRMHFADGCSAGGYRLSTLNALVRVGVLVRTGPVTKVGIFILSDQWK